MAITFYEQSLTDDGVVICFSMFHDHVRRANLFKAFQHTLYTRIQQIRGSRERPFQNKRVQQAAIFVNFKTKNDNRIPILTEIQPTLNLGVLPVVEAIKILDDTFKDRLYDVIKNDLATKLKRSLLEAQKTDVQGNTDDVNSANLNKKLEITEYEKYSDLESATMPPRHQDASWS